MKRVVDDIKQRLDSNKNKQKRRKKGGVMWRARDGNYT